MTQANLTETLFKPRFKHPETSTLVRRFNPGTMPAVQSALDGKNVPHWYRMINRLMWIWRGIDPREILDVQFAVEKDRGNLRALEQVLQVAVQARQHFVLADHLRIDRLQLLIDRLHFLLGSFELFVRGLKFLVDRLILLVGRFHFLVGSLQFVDCGLQPLARRHQLLLDTVAGRFRHAWYIAAAGGNRDDR